jgi:cytoskeletal protein CcmA (bactofilin family)
MFAKSQTAAGAPAKPAKGGPRLSIIGPEVIISGDLATDAQLHVDGRIDGNVRCVGLCQGADGIIAGNIIADEARLAGTVEGTVSARSVVVEASARIMGDIAYETVSIEAGAGIEGRLARRAALAKPEDEKETLTVTPVSFSPAKAEAETRLFPQS